MASLHHRAKELFLAALERPIAERAAFLSEACGDEAALKQEVEQLLSFHDDRPDEEGAGEPSKPVFSTGELFAGRYRMITRLGRGGMGDVWRADDIVLGAPVAVKVIFQAGPKGRERLFNEVRLARQITHPNV